MAKKINDKIDHYGYEQIMTHGHWIFTNSSSVCHLLPYLLLFANVFMKYTFLEAKFLRPEAHRDNILIDIFEQITNNSWIKHESS